MCGVSLIELVELAILLIGTACCRVAWISSEEDNSDQTGHGGAGSNKNEDQTYDKKQLMNKMFQLTESARQLRERHVYPIKVPLNTIPDEAVLGKPANYQRPNEPPEGSGFTSRYSSI
jgi:hypothetical protein